jgi:hypothetical protein
MSSPAPHRQRTTADVVAIVRRSLVGVRSASSGGTGFVVLGNGLVMTSHEAAGYQGEVVLDLESGRRCEGRVIWVDVARDLALVLPAERLPLPPLLPRPDLPRLGEPALSVSAVPEQPWRVLSALVSAVDCRIGPLRCFELDTRTASCGGPIVDLDGRLIGVGGLDLPRGTRRRAAPASGARSLAIPIAALERVLAAVDVPTEQFAERSPTYRCPACGDPFDAREERCLACGRLLPHGWEMSDPGPGAAAIAGAERLLRDLLVELGGAFAGVRTGPRTLRLGARGADGTPITLEISESGNTVRGKLSLLRVPPVNQEPFYRFLLTLNDQTTGTQRFSVEGDTVYLSFTEPTALVRPGEIAARIQELGREGERYRKALGEPFDVAQVG